MSPHGLGPGSGPGAVRARPRDAACDAELRLSTTVTPVAVARGIVKPVRAEATKALVNALGEVRRSTHLRRASSATRSDVRLRESRDSATPDSASRERSSASGLDATDAGRSNVSIQSCSPK